MVERRLAKANVASSNLVSRSISSKTRIFVKSKILLSLSTIWKFILPLGAIIVSSEVMRRIFLSHKIELTYRSKKFEFSVILTFIAMVMMDLLMLKVLTLLM